MATGYINIPEFGSPSWRDPVASFVDLPTNGNQLGDARVTLDTDTIYIWNGTMWVASGSGSGTVTSLNGLTGALTLVAGTNISITPSGTNITIASVGGGTVTSVGLADSTGIFNITGSPVTSSGTLTLASLQSQSANTFLAAPNGSSGAPTFRNIVVADVPTLNQNTTGTASNVTGIVAIVNGGTGQTTAASAYNALSPMTTTGDIEYEASANTAARLPIGTTGQVLTVASGIPAWANNPGVGATQAEFFGSGINGSATVSSVITLTADTFYQNLTAASGGQINTAGWILFVAGTLDLTNAPAGFIQNNGSAGGAGAATGGTAGTLGAGAAGTYSNSGTTSVGGGAPGVAGGLGSKTAGAQGSVASPLSNALGGSATAAGAGGTGASGAGGGFRNGGAATYYPFNRLTTLFARVVNGVWQTLGGGAGGGAGSGGGGDGTVFGGGGGGSGGGGGVCAIFANNVIVASTTSSTAIQANGGAGGAGGSPPTSTNGAGGGGAGSGGGGGCVYLVYNTRSGPASTTIGEAAGGNGANGGNGVGTSGTAGGGSGGGWSGTTMAINASTGVITTVSSVIGNLASGQTGGTGAVSLLTI